MPKIKMSLHYGVSKHTYETDKMRNLSYQPTFRQLNKSDPSYQQQTVPGFPAFRMYCEGHRPDAGFKILTHRFDRDSIIAAPFTLRYGISCFFGDRSTPDVWLEEVDYFDANIFRCFDTFFVKKEFKFKDIPGKNNRELLAFSIYFLQLTGGSYSNESVMDIVVDY